MIVDELEDAALVPTAHEAVFRFRDTGDRGGGGGGVVGSKVGCKVK